MLLFDIFHNLTVKTKLRGEITYSGHDTERIKTKSSSLDAWRNPVLTPNYQVTQVTMNMANHFVCSRIASKDYFHSRMSRYPNSVSTFHLIRLFVILEQVPLLKTAIVSLALVAFIRLRLAHLVVLSTFTTLHYVLSAHGRDYTFRVGYSQQVICIILLSR